MDEVRCDGVEVVRGGFRLGPINLTIGRGVTVLVGRNGAGKTTLLQALVGLVPAVAGRVEVAGVAHGDRRRRAELARRIGYVPQGAEAPGGARVVDLLRYAAWLKAVPRAETAARVADALDELDVAHLATRRARTLSGGERQRVSIAMSLVHRPVLLVLDEPSVGLDPVQRVALRGLVDRLGETRAVVVSTHVVADIDADDDTVVVLDAGTLTFTGTAAAVAAGARPGDSGGSDLERGLWRLLGAGA
ncbi:ATP-binding cassette domain-containing protein [Pimelobacter sp. 30-1]|uniref:ATP-binding cassette domain-containing protein n=1 Tax=Pimelobacter sp. 30-1 TaxID=2004991 RepID=UPI001C04F313|nr:ATP-binding cassette domain-containing protein [Pimelobacter sp. 30-1]MBU2694744.1 hypothetical protein [Pimelobacter sp. 30-1]